MPESTATLESIPLRPLGSSLRRPSALYPLASHRPPRLQLMKFSSALKFNAVADWWDNYIAYDALKKTIYQLEKRQHEQLSQSLQVGRARSGDRPYRDVEANEDEAALLINNADHTTNLITPPPPNQDPIQHPTGTNVIFIPLLNKELRKVVKFYKVQEIEIEQALNELQVEIEEQDRVWITGRRRTRDQDVERYRDDPDDYDEEADDYEYRYGNADTEEGDEDDAESFSKSPIDRKHRLRSKSGSRGPATLMGARRRQDSLSVPGTSAQPARAQRLSSSSSDGHGLEENAYSMTRAGTDATATVIADGSTFVPRHRKESTANSTLGRITNKITTAVKDSMTSSGFLDSAVSPQTPVMGSTHSIWTANSDYAYDMRLLFKRKITNLFVVASNLKSYVEVNYSGFRKVLKKYDKVTDSELQQPYLTQIVSQAPPFTQDRKSYLNHLLTQLIDLYTRCVVRGDLSLAKQQLKLHVRENIAWERDTVWRQMIAAERRGEMVGVGGGGALGLGGRRGGGGDDDDEQGDEEAFGKGIGSMRVESDDEFERLFDNAAGGAVAHAAADGDIEAGRRGDRTRSGSLLRTTTQLLKVKPGKRGNILIEWETRTFGKGKITKKKAWMLFAILVLIVLVNVPMIGVGGDDGGGGDPEERARNLMAINRCFAILVFCTIMWATEAAPLFVTSLAVPLLLVLLQVIRANDGKGKVLTRPEATKYVFSIMFSPTIMLLIGGFTISSALSKTNIDRVIITRVLSLAGSKPSTVLLAFMGVSCFASMWISNVAAPTLCFTLIKPILRTLPPKSAFGPCLILAIALAANIGGQSSPISSPQNLIAFEHMDPQLSWASWFAVSLPVSAISIVIIWLLLLASYNPSRHPDPTEGYIEIKAIRPTRERFTVKQWWVTAVCLVTIGLWCVAHQIQDVMGDMGVIALVPIVAFFSTGVLKKDDFDQFMWTIVFLAMGGIALGKGVVCSGLLEVLDVVIRRVVKDFSLYTVVLVLSPIVLVISTFISHTIASVLLVPIAKAVGQELDGSPHNLLIFITALICSAGMGMPVSGFPNQTAATQEDELGELYLSNVDFLKNGVPASVIATLIVATVGFALMKAIGI